MNDLDIEIALMYLDDMDKYHGCNEYKTIKQSLEKQKAKKPIWIKRSVAQFQVCPSCSDSKNYNMLSRQEKYCHRCGQKIDWSDDK